MNAPSLLELLPRGDDATSDAILDAFLAYCRAKGLSLYPAQEEAVLELLEGRHVVLATPTGSGKSMVALAACARALARGERAFYTAPIKALVAEKFFELCKALGPEHVGMMTGDAAVNRDAPIICCTAEILANLALRRGDDAAVATVVMDEFHYYGDRDRGTAWQVPLVTLRATQFLLMSATLGDVTAITASLEASTGRPVVQVTSVNRPVPLHFVYRETPLLDTALELLRTERAPVYLVHFTQRAASERAQDFMSYEVLTKEQKARVKEALARFRFDTPFGKDLKRWVHHGIGVHHAGMLPKYRRMVERLAQEGLLKLICGTDTLGVGVNVPIRSVVFTQLCKFDGDKTAVVSAREFHQIAGRAGRKGFDDVGYVYCQAPEHVVENLMAQRKAEGDPKKQRKLVTKKPPERGYAHWDAQTFERLIGAHPERLSSRFEVSHGLVMNVLARGPDGCTALRTLLRSTHDSRVVQRRNGRKAVSIVRSLRDVGILELAPTGPRVHEDLQRDFSLDSAHGLFVVEGVLSLDRESPTYALEVVSLVEATLEDPRAVLERQLDTLKTRAITRMKAEGLEYDERMAELEKVENPRPGAAALYALFDEFRKKHPWASGGIAPKSVVRDMYEEGESFLGYVKAYGLARSEGVLLRYLTDAYKALVQTVPEGLRTPELEQLLEWLGTNVRSIDASLLVEWEALQRGETPAIAASTEAASLDEDDVTADPKAFAVLVRNEIFRLVRAIARKDYVRACEILAEDGEDVWTVDRFEAALEPYYAAYDVIRTDPVARAPRFITLETSGRLWRAKQTLLDPEEHGEFFLDLDVDLDRSREAGKPVLILGDLGD